MLKILCKIYTNNLKQPNWKRMWKRRNFPLVMKNVSLFVFDCVTAGMPLLQGLASCFSVMFVWIALPNLVNAVYLKSVLCHSKFQLSTTYHIKRSFFPQSRMLQFSFSPTHQGNHYDLLHWFSVLQKKVYCSLNHRETTKHQDSARQMWEGNPASCYGGHLPSGDK